MRYIYITDSSYNNPSLAKVEVYNETEKTFSVKSKYFPMGWMYISSRIRKSETKCFETIQEALADLIKTQTEAIAAAERRLEESRLTLQYLRNALETPVGSSPEADNQQIPPAPYQDSTI